MSADLSQLQAKYLQLVGETLPRAAAKHPVNDPMWPVRLDHCFARIILDQICGGPWRAQLAPPAYKRLNAQQLQQALDLGAAILDGTADLPGLNAQSLRWRGKLSERQK